MMNRWRNRPISRAIVNFFRSSTDPLAALATERVADASMIRGKVLRPALFALLQQGSETVDYGSNTTSAEAEPWLDRFEQQVDATFFPELWREAAAEGDERERLRRDWRRQLADVAIDLLDDAARSVPQAAMRRYRAKVRARGLFFGLLHKHFQDLKIEERHDHTA
jgi:CRISPR system Cascade subunit CasA